MSARRRTACALLLLGAGACAAPDAEIQLAPLYARHTVPGFQRTEAVGGALRHLDDGRFVTWAAAPLVWWQHDRAPGGWTRSDFLFGLGRYEHDPERPRTQARIFPLWWYESERRPDGVQDTDWALLAWLIAGGSSSDGEEDYFWIFPLGGVGKDFLTYDEFRFVLFPFWLRNEKDGRTSTHVLWPIFGWQEGSECGWRIFPFYGTAEVPGKYRRRFVLWPFWTETEEALDQPHPRRGWFLFPLYGEMEQDDYRARTLLWPFGGWAARPSTGYRSWALWPLLKVEEGGREEDRRVRRVLPFYLHFENAETRFTSWAWPFWWTRHDDFGDLEREGRWLVPFFWDTDTRYDDGGRAAHLRVWPLFSQRLRRDGSRLLRVLDPGLPPIVDPEFLSRLYGFVYEVWATRAAAPRPPVREERAWLGLYHRAESGGHVRWSVPGLMGRWTEPDGTRHTSLLFGFIRWRSGDDGGMEAPAFPGPGWPDLHRVAIEGAGAPAREDAR